MQFDQTYNGGMKHHAIRAYRNKAFFYGLLPILGLVAILGLILLRLEGAQSPAQQLPDTSRSQQVVVELTKQDLRAGWEERQARFEATNPQYPDAEGINYPVVNNELVGDIDPADQLVWDIVVSLAPTDEVLGSTSEFFVYFDEEDDTLAFVESTDERNTSWTFGINYLAVNSFEDLVPTIIHEYGHILSLQDSQTIVDSEESGILSSCSTYLVEEGCLDQDSYLAEFYNQFWTEPGFDIQRDRTAEESLVFFEQNPGVFVSDYATTNPAEDFAETLMTYVIEDRGENDTATDKLDFLASYQELVDYRDNARRLIAAWGQ